MSTTPEEARRLSQELKDCFVRGISSADTTVAAGHALCSMADEIGRLNALAGPGGKSLGELERINDDLIADIERLKTSAEDAWRAGFDAGAIYGVAEDRYDPQRDPEHERPERPQNPYAA